MDWATKIATWSIAGNEPWQILAFLGVLFLSGMASKVSQFGLRRLAALLQRRDQQFARLTVQNLERGVQGLCVILGLHLGFSLLRLNEALREFFRSLVSVLTISTVAWVLYRLVDVVEGWLRSITARTASRLDDMLVPLVRKSLRVAIVVLAFLQVATVLSDKPVTSLLAGLGVGGLAVALAAQETLKNFFGSLIIFADKPFEIGDFIVVEGHEGIVQEVGFRSIRLRTLDGHLVTIPNGELAGKAIRNISRRPSIRRVMEIGLPYDTPPEKVEHALAILRDVLANHEGMNPQFPPRVFFSGFKDWSLAITVIYWYFSTDYWAYMAFSERLNLTILKRFNEANIEFAFPTQTVFLAGDVHRPIVVAAGREGDQDRRPPGSLGALS